MARTSKPKPEPHSLYLIGIKGVAMTGLAIMAKQLGYEVTGSDVAETFITDELLDKNKIAYFESFEAAHLQPKPDLVVVGAAYGAQNPEVKAIKSLRLTSVTQSEMLGKLMTAFEGVGVAGVHGKTTTTAMLAFILNEAGFSPSYAIGTAHVPGLEGNSHIGDGKYFVAEADDYKKSDTNLEPKFLDLPLKHVIITSIELDHPDIYQSAEDVYSAFYKLSTKIPRDGSIVACTDWPLVRRLVSRRVDRPCLTYGFEPSAQYRIIDVQPTQTTKFTIRTPEGTIGPIELQQPGRHNILNATAAAVMAERLGVSEAAILSALRHFKGPQRRFELLGEFNGAPVFDDYAHHPTAITYLLEAARQRFPTKRLVVVFQPHTYSRTGKFLKEFARSLAPADKVILLNIFASAREKSGYVSIRDLITELRALKPDVEYRATLDDVAAYLKGSITSNDVVLLVGAGDVYKVFSKLSS
jgi:UDP-N-acetylmuramate--alanine ligase